MTKKLSTITLTHIPCFMHWSTPDNRVPAWRVETVTDSVEFSPQEYLRKAQVTDLCASKDWKVTIKGERS